jgi:SNF2 family DNA or RNA helicase
LNDWLWDEYEDRIEPATEAHDWAMNPRNDADGNELLYPYQRTGTLFLLEALNGAALTDEPGTGKTAHAIELLEQDDLYPALIVMPKSAKSGWLREFQKWAPHRDVVSVNGSAVQRRKLLEETHDVFFITWESLRIHSRLAPYGSVRLTAEERVPKELNRHWGAVVADEAHRGVDPKAKQTRALWAVGANADYRLALTGTPIANSPADFWSILHFIAPHEWPSKTKFIERYCLQMYNASGYLDVTGLQSNHAEEFHSLVKVRHLRRPKELVLPWLPTKVYETIDVEMTTPQKKAYRELQKSLIADVDGGTVLTLDPLSLLTRLTQAACATLSIDDGKVVLSNPSSKVDALVELMKDMGDDPIVVFALSRQLIELAATRLEKEKISFSKIVGGQSDLVRFSEENAFYDGTSRAILLTLGAGSEALTLTRASTTCFMQRSWSMVQNKQAEDRTHRPGQDAEKVLIIDMVAPDTVEESQWSVLQGKSGMLEEITQDRQAMLRVIRGK